MTLETAMDAAQFLIKNAEEVGQVPSINFFGGEPMLKWDEIIVPLTNWIRNEYKKPFSLSMTTNGTLLNDARIQFMKDNNIGLLFSIDGAKETQDYNRPYHNGIGSFDSLQDIIPKIAEKFTNATFRSTVIPPTCHHVFDNIMFAKQSGFNNFYIIPNVFEEWDDDAKNTLISEFQKYVDYYIDEYRSGQIPIEFSPLSDVFQDIKSINYASRNNQFRDTRRCKACGKCGLGSNKSASVHPNGNLYGCQEMTSNVGEESIFYIGNIYSGVDDDKRLELMELFDRQPVVGDDCEKCLYNRICDGGCVANNYLINQDVSTVPKMYCWWKRVVLDGAIQIMQTLGREENATFRKKWGGKQ